MAKDLIIVESPAKVKTISKFLGSHYSVMASVGHIRDLPKSTLAVDETNGFAPHYEIIEGKEKIVASLCQAAEKAGAVYLAPDPDREGEAIAWHIAALIRDKNDKIQRIQFNEISAKAVKEALQHPRPLNADLFDAQQARRILDRLVGYKLSPLLWKKVKRGISAGRVQSVALRLIVDREKERRAFVPEEYWLIRALLDSGEAPQFTADLSKIDKKKAKISSAEEAAALEARIAQRQFIVQSVTVKNKERSPAPPFITSTLQQHANQRHGYSAKRTMNIAQRLYEGIDLGDQGTTALITYMRTDSVRISDEARENAKDYIIATWGADYYPAKARHFSSKQSSQDAHEAIRPINVDILPESIKHLLSPEQYQLYKLIWTRFLASQMAAAKFEDTTVLTECNGAEFKAKGERTLFPGFHILSPQKSEGTVELPQLTQGQTVQLVKLNSEQKFTQAPARYGEASLVRELEEKGIGRPSTYASIISTLLDRDYVSLQDKHFIPTDLGCVVCELLCKYFTQLLDVHFTAAMEEALDKVASGEENWVELLSKFSKEFNPTLTQANEAMDSVKGGLPTGLPCPECTKDTVIKFGKAGPFLACSGYPACRFTSDFTRDESGQITMCKKEQPVLEVMGICPECGADLVLKKARTGSRFIACSAYPQCRHAAPFSVGIPCPQCHQGELVEKSSKKGKIFYACNRYPQCDYAMWDKPVATTCPQCGWPVMGEKNTRGQHKLVCPLKSCGCKINVEES